MDGYQPEKKCTNCLAFNICKKKYKNQVCKKYKECKPAPPPKSGSNVMLQPMPEVKPPKQHTVLSVRDFAILYNIANNKIMQMESQAQNVLHWGRDNKTEEDVEKERAENVERLRQHLDYQDLLRIRDKLGELNIEVDTPIVEVEE